MLKCVTDNTSCSTDVEQERQQTNKKKDLKKVCSGKGIKVLT